MGRGPTAYFIFTGEQRPHVREKLLAERGGDKVSVADVAKEMGAMWRQLSDDEKQKYKDAAAAAAAANVDPSSSKDGDKGSAKKEQRAMLPLSLVKKVICRDEEVKRVSGDAVRVIAEATGMFIGLLATRSLEYAKAQKRKNFKFSDIESAARSDSRMKEIGLPISFEHEDVFVEMKKRRVDGSGGGGGGGGRKRKESGGGAGKGKTLHSFFAPRVAPAEREEEPVVVVEEEEEEQENEDGDIVGEEEQAEVLEEDQQEEEQQQVIEEEEEEEKGGEEDGGNT
ncbi:hypothetical protein M9435_006523 [Picochlorum sp. BPE23]|nr:hypothetical protein M9435_006523 [Picochlorum sp. BPE23]